MIFSLDPIRNLLSNRPVLTTFFAGILAGLIQPPLFCFWAIIGFTTFAFQIHSSPNISNMIKRHFAFCFGFFGYGFYWTVIAISIRLSEFWWAIPIALVGMPLIFVLLTLPASLLSWRLSDTIYFPLILALAWVFVEWLTSFLFTGLPWMIVAYGIGFSDIFSQGIGLIGMYGISLIILYIAFQFYYVLYHDNRIKLSSIYIILLVVGAFGIYGYIRLENHPLKFTDARVRIVQPTTSQKDQWSFDILWQDIIKLSKLSSLSTRIKPDIVIWPESAIAANYNAPQIFDHMLSLAKEIDAVLMTGTISVEERKYYNSFVGFAPEGDVLFDYRKKHLVPFGEYMPFKEYLAVNKLTFGIADYSRGEGQNIFHIDKVNMKIRPLICYETLFPGEIDGSDGDVFINITNTAWYGNSTAPHHLFYVNKFRAIENGMPVIISSNNGISGMFDGMGRLVAKTSLNDIIALDLYIPAKIGHSSKNTLIWLLCLIIGLFGLSYLGDRYERSRK